MREVVSKPQTVVMDFLERYFFELNNTKGTAVERKMADDKVYFRKGSPANLLMGCDTLSFSLTLHDRYYEAIWNKDDTTFINIVFPAQYDLLLGQQKDEATKRLKEFILASPPRKDSIVPPSEMMILNDSIYQSQGDSLIVASLSNTIYYNKVDDKYLPVFDKDNFAHSASNLFLGQIPDADYNMYIEQSVYEMTTINYSITMNQWLNYCSEWKLNTFFAVEEEREDGILALVICQSKELGFHHLLSVIIPDKFIGNNKAVLKVRMTPYIPTHNVKNLYKIESNNHKKVRWQ